MTECDNADMRDLLPGLAGDARVGNAREGGALPAAERAALEQHVAGCAACGAELRLLADARDALERSARVDVDRIAASVVAATLRPVPVLSLDTTRARRRGWLPAAAMLAAATIVIAAGVGLLADRPAPRTDAPAVAMRTPAAASAANSPTANAAAAPAPGDSPPAATQEARPARAESLPLDANLALASDEELETFLAQIDALDATLAREPDQMVALGSITGELE